MAKEFDNCCKNNANTEENLLVYEYDEKKNIKNINENEKNELIKLGFRCLKNYFIIKDIENFESNQSFSYKNNMILYISFCINQIYSSIVILEEDEQKIYIGENSLIKSLIQNLNDKNIDDEFHYKLRYFNLSF